MSAREDLRAGLRREAADVVGRLSPGEREALLVKSWMSHDARWFMAVAREYGMEAANRLNRIAAHDVGKVEARRIARALGLPPVIGVDDYLLVQEILIGLLGPDLLDYRVTRAGDAAFQVHVQKCFAHENAVRAGIDDSYECGIFERVTGWLDALGLAYEVSPSLGRCLRAQGRGCSYTITLREHAD